MKIIVGLSSLDLGGSMISAIELAASVQDQLGWEVAVYAPPGRAGKLLAERGLRHIEAPDGEPGWTLSHYRHLRHVDRVEQPDVFHAWDWQLLIRAYYALHLRNRPVMGSCTAMSVPSLLPWALPISFVTAEIQGQDAHRQGASFLQEYPINVRLDDPATVVGSAFRAEIGVRPDQLLLVIVSRLARWMKREGIARTIEVVERLAADHDVVLAVVGDGDARNELEGQGDRVNRSAGRELVRFAGPMVDPRTAYASADIGLGMGTSIVRSMAFEVPSVVLGDRASPPSSMPSTPICCVTRVSMVSALSKGPTLVSRLSSVTSSSIPSCAAASAPTPGTWSSDASPWTWSLAIWPSATGPPPRCPPTAAPS